MRCMQCDKHVGNKECDEHELWCSDMEFWQLNKFGRDRVLVAAMEKCVASSKVHNDYMHNLNTLLKRYSE